MRDWIVQCSLKTPRGLAGTLIYNHRHSDWRDVIPRINLPTLIISGRASVIPRSQSDDLVQKQGVLGQHGEPVVHALSVFDVLPVSKELRRVS
jgi:hypothetical protein